MDGGYPQYCDSGDSFSTKNLDSSTLNSMDCEWISLTGSNSGFWSHEWSKHGTCSLTVLPTQEDYFSKALLLNSEYDVNVRSIIFQHGRMYPCLIFCVDMLDFLCICVCR